jgi:hypothetical protein
MWAVISADLAAQIEDLAAKRRKYPPLGGPPPHRRPKWGEIAT